MYCKIFSSLYQGTLRGRSNAILVFTNLLAHCDRDGFVDKHWRAIAEETGLSIDQVKEACIELEAPDPESRSTELDGARIERVADNRAWGWRVVNYLKYRAIKNDETRREQTRAAQARFREKQRNQSSKVITGNQKSSQGEASGYGKEEVPIPEIVDQSSSSPTGSEVDEELPPIDGEEASPPRKSPVFPESSHHHAFMKGWCESWKMFHGKQYKFAGGRDGKAVKELLRMNILVADLIETAKRAWDRAKTDPYATGAVKQAATIHGFETRFNDIIAELGRTPSTNGASRTSEDAAWAVKRAKMNAKKERIEILRAKISDGNGTEADRVERDRLKEEIKIMQQNLAV